MQRTYKIDQEMIDRYGVINGDNDIIHYDHDYARGRGFRGTLLHGPHMTALAADLGAQRYGKDWLYRGRLRTKWVGPSCPGDTFAVRLDPEGGLEAASGGSIALVGEALLTDAGQRR